MVITVTGAQSRQFSSTTLREQHTLEERTIPIVCASTGRSTGTWRGIRMSQLIDTAPIPPETTHLLVEATDGYRAPVPIGDALQSFLGLTRLDGPDDTPRLLGDRLSSERAVQDVTRIDCLRLSPEEDPDEYASW